MSSISYKQIIRGIYTNLVITKKYTNTITYDTFRIIDNYINNLSDWMIEKYNHKSIDDFVHYFFEDDIKIPILDKFKAIKDDDDITEKKNEDLFKQLKDKDSFLCSHRLIKKKFKTLKDIFKKKENSVQKFGIILHHIIEQILDKSCNLYNKKKIEACYINTVINTYFPGLSLRLFFNQNSFKLAYDVMKNYI